MLTLQLPSCRALRRSSLGGAYSNEVRSPIAAENHLRLKERTVRIVAMCSYSPQSHLKYKMNLNEYMVTLDKPLGIRFAVSVDGNIFVHAIKKGSNAEKSRIVMVGDTLKRVGTSSEGKLDEVKDVADAQTMLKEKTGAYSLVLERPFTPFPIQELLLMNDLDNLFNRGRVPFATWNNTVLASSLQSSSGSSGNSGFVTFSSKFLKSQGWNFLDGQNGHVQSKMQKKDTVQPMSQLVCILSEVEPGDGEWGYGNFQLDEYIKALDRSKGELYYNHSLGMRYTKITEQLFVGSCIQTEDDVQTLANIAGITAILNFQTGTETENWGVNSLKINDSCQKFDLLMINYPIRDGDSYDLRKKLPFCVGLLLRLLKKNHRVFVTCTNGLDRSPSCVIAYLHWMTDTSLHAAYNFVTGLHLCKPDRPAIAWATWDLMAMVSNGKLDGGETHSVTFVWNGHEGDDVKLVGDFTSSWAEPIQVNHKEGPRFEAEVRLSQGKYYYKFIVNGQWRHSTSSPAERDNSGNVNNVIIIGDTASVRPSVQQQQKDTNVIKVIERPLTETERFMLAKAARCISFSICPIRFAPK